MRYPAHPNVSLKDLRRKGVYNKTLFVPEASESAKFCSAVIGFRQTSMRIKTFVSPVSYRPNVLDSALSPVVMNGEEVCWLDSLLGGGVVIPTPVTQYRRRPLIWLVSGPPGTGKTTFGLELCYRLSTRPQSEYGNRPLDVIYFSAESSKEVIEENMRTLGWSEPPPGFEIKGYEAMRNIATAGELFGLLPKRGATPKITADDPDCLPDCHLVVVDSLNVLASQLTKADWSPASLIKSIDEQMTGKAWILVLMQDWEHDQGRDPAYAFIADIETRFYERPFKNYLLHYFRVVKMRFQAHARGNHAVKIYARQKCDSIPAQQPCDFPKVLAPADSGSVTEARVGGNAIVESANRTIPASQATSVEITEGGIYILPSIHRHLSAVALEPIPALPPEALQVPVAGLERFLPLGQDASGNLIFGFPKRRCTALVGSRGAMKSHLAYLTMLKALENPETFGIMFSLRDDIRAAQTTLDQIAFQQGLAAGSAQAYRSESRLDIVYFAPGYIPPEEFMHRVVVAIEGMIQRRAGQVDGRNIVVVLNGIDHLAARHPLCAAEDMFVPALISYLRKNRVTSLVIAANDDPKPIDDSGLLPMADLLLQFKACDSRPSALPQDAQQVTEVLAQRVPAGATSGREGYMYRRTEANGKLEFCAFERRTDPLGAESILLLPQ